MIDVKALELGAVEHQPPPAYTDIYEAQDDVPLQQIQNVVHAPPTQAPTPQASSGTSRPPAQPASTRGASGLQQQQPQATRGMSEAELGRQYQQQLYARCARGDHEVETKHGAMGIICAVFLFPIGLLCLFMDVKRKCTRCGIELE